MKHSYFSATDFYWTSLNPIFYQLKVTEINLNSSSSPAEVTVENKMVVIIYLYSENVLTLFGLQALNAWFLNGSAFRMSVGKKNPINTGEMMWGRSSKPKSTAGTLNKKLPISQHSHLNLILPSLPFFLLPFSPLSFPPFSLPPLFLTSVPPHSLFLPRISLAFILELIHTYKQYANIISILKEPTFPE